MRPYCNTGLLYIAPGLRERQILRLPFLAFPTGKPLVLNGAMKKFIRTLLRPDREETNLEADEITRAANILQIGEF